MNNKEKYIKACKQMIERYQNITKDTPIGVTNACPMCKVTGKTYEEGGSCMPCPIYEGKSGYDCVIYSSYTDAIKARNKGYKVCIERVTFYRNLLKIIKRLPPERFTKKGFKPLGLHKRGFE